MSFSPTRRALLCAAPDVAAVSLPHTSLAEVARDVGHGFYQALDKRDLAAIGPLLADQVTMETPQRRGLSGRQAVVTWVQEMLTAFNPRIDLISTTATATTQLLTINLTWRHDRVFFGLQPTGREGTSLQSWVLETQDGVITQIQVAEQTLDLSIYLWDRGWPLPHSARPPAQITGTTPA